MPRDFGGPPGGARNYCKLQLREDDSRAVNRDNNTGQVNAPTAIARIVAHKQPFRHIRE